MLWGFLKNNSPEGIIHPPCLLRFQHNKITNFLILCLSTFYYKNKLQWQTTVNKY